MITNRKLGVVIDLLIVSVLILGYVALGSGGAAFPSEQRRTYHVVTVSALKTTSWTHVAVRACVGRVADEPDGDVHISFVDPGDARRKVIAVAEIIPGLSVEPRPRKGDCGTFYGISRIDRRHGWAEVHPLERWVRE